MAVLTPADLWVSEAPWAGGLRQALAEHWDTLVVLYGQGAISDVHPTSVVAAAFLRAKGESRPHIKIFQALRGDDDAAVDRDFEHLLARGGGRGRNGYVVRDMPPPQESLDFDRHDPAVLERREDLAGFGGLSTLGDLCDTVARINLTADAQLIRSEEEPGAVRLLGGRDIQRDGTIAPLAEDTKWVQAPFTHLLKPGDLVLRAMYAVGDPHGFTVAQVTEQDLPAAAPHTAVALRPHADVEPQRLRLAVMFLRTPLARTLAGGSRLHVSVSALQALPVPQPDEALTKAFDDLTAARQRLEEWQKEADSLLESVFLDKTAAKARSRIVDSGRSLRLRVEAASLLDELGHTVRTRFPYPIAYRWRETEARMSAGDLQAAYGAVLDTAEILLCYTSQLALALAQEAGVGLGAVTAVKDKLAGGRSGPGFGDWAAVLTEVATSRKLRNLPAEHPLHDIRGLLAGQDTAEARQRLSERRNDQAHLRRVDAVDLLSAIQTAFADVTTLVERARFLADWGLLHVTEVRWDALSRTAHVAYRELMGDHPVVPTRSMSSPSNDLEAGSLYLRDSDHALHLLRPFLVGQDCPTCRVWSTFHVDRVPKSGVLLKSLEHGHVFEEPSPAMPAALRYVGLL
ncbi:restriction endonuclease [Streptomyces sp. NPDC059460]|uniref:restriction endonuclease n=1 Tax=Streptomyces sp. NPDC059460 TaxID=3346840 RepID=UPI0036CE3136